MESTSTILARKYAKAFVAVFGDQLTMADIQKIRAAKEAMAQMPHLSFFLQLPSLPEENKKRSLHAIIRQHDLPAYFESLVNLLLAHKRSFMLYPVMRAITKLVMRKKNMQPFMISSVQELDQQARADIETFLHNTTKATIIGEYTLDKRLIAGIRMQSDTLLWQHSIKQYLDALNRLLI